MKVLLVAEGLAPGYFALVMATGIVSLGLYRQGFAVASNAMLGIAVAAYVVLLILVGTRIARIPAAFRADLADPHVSFAFFTFVAGSNVLSVRFAEDAQTVPAVLLAVVGLLAWLILGYLVPWSAFLGQRHGSLLTSVNGTWFIWSVASQSVAVSAGALDPLLAGYEAWLGIVAVLSWSVGIVLYSAAAMLLALRVIIHGLEPKEFTPPFWVCMGAMAIAVVAGARIVGMSSTPMVDAVRILAGGSSVVFWCFAAWLIPALIFGGIWRHGIHRVPLRYEAGLWSIIFPLGMFAVASMNLGVADNLPAVEIIGEWWLWLAFGGWVAVSIALITRMTKSVRTA